MLCIVKIVVSNSSEMFGPFHENRVCAFHVTEVHELFHKCTREQPVRLGGTFTQLNNEDALNTL